MIWFPPLSKAVEQGEAPDTALVLTSTTARLLSPFGGWSTKWRGCEHGVGSGSIEGGAWPM